MMTTDIGATFHKYTSINNYLENDENCRYSLCSFEIKPKKQLSEKKRGNQFKNTTPKKS